MIKRIVGILLTLCMTLTLLPTTALAAAKVPADGWYNIRVLNIYINVNEEGSAELRRKTENQAFYVEKKGDSQVTLKMADGRYLGTLY